MKENLIIYTSNRNNYDMLNGEVLKNIPFNGFEYISVDDNSCETELNKGIELSKKYQFLLLKNKSRGVQMATQTLVDFINEKRPKCKWIFCFQHDNYPLDFNFFERISRLIDSNQVINFGGMGFNVLDTGKYTFDSFEKWKRNENPLGMLGLSHLGIKDNSKRWISPRHNPLAVENSQNWRTPFIIEMPMWAAVGINIEVWNKVIKPTNEYHFHLWYPDIAMQLNLYGFPIIILPKLYCMNNQKLKFKYNINENSAKGARDDKNEYHFGEYSNFAAWNKRWGWEYENVEKTFPVELYEDTLLGQYFEYNIMDTKRPYKTVDLGEY